MTKHGFHIITRDSPAPLERIADAIGIPTDHWVMDPQGCFRLCLTEAEMEKALQVGALSLEAKVP